MGPLQASHRSSSLDTRPTGGLHDDIPWLRSAVVCSLRICYRVVILASVSSRSALSQRVPALWLRGWMGPLQARHRSRRPRRWFRLRERPLRRPVARERSWGFPTDWLIRLQNFVVTWLIRVHVAALVGQRHKLRVPVADRFPRSGWFADARRNARTRRPRYVAALGHAAPPHSQRGRSTRGRSGQHRATLGCSSRGRFFDVPRFQPQPVVFSDPIRRSSV